MHIFQPKIEVKGYKGYKQATSNLPDVGVSHTFLCIHSVNPSFINVGKQWGG